MAKGMNLDEFKNALSSDARIENEKLKKDIKHLKETINELTEERNTYKDQCRTLGNRCYVFTEGTMCLNCNVEACGYHPSIEDIMEAANYIIKNNMPRNEETRAKVNNFIARRKEMK